MKLLHFADLHLGKVLYQHSLLADQRAILRQILDIARQEEVSAILLAGDVFDRPQSSQEALRLFNDFLEELTRADLDLFLISGNHDSSVRLGYGSQLFAKHGLHFATSIAPQVRKIAYTQADETVDIYLLPYMRYVDLKRLYPEEAGASYVQLMQKYLAPSLLELRQRHKEGIPSVLLAHQWLLNRAGQSLESSSEEKFVGMVEELPAQIFADFDYIALGHLHRPQLVGGKAYYSGSPLAYSASEAGQEKSLSILSVQAGQIEFKTHPLKPLYPVQRLRGPLEEILSTEGPAREAYTFVELTDERLLPKVKSKLSQVFPRLCHIDFLNYSKAIEESSLAWKKSNEPQSLEAVFAEFFDKFCGHPLSDKQRTLVQESLAQCKEERCDP